MSGILAQTMARDPRVIQWTSVLFLAIVLLLIFAFGAAAIIHFSRRYRQFLLREKREPTPSDDVWEMHRVPPDPDDAPPDQF